MVQCSERISADLVVGAGRQTKLSHETEREIQYIWTSCVVLFHTQLVPQREAIKPKMNTFSFTACPFPHKCLEGRLDDEPLVGWVLAGEELPPCGLSPPAGTGVRESWDGRQIQRPELANSWHHTVLLLVKRVWWMRNTNKPPSERRIPRAMRWLPYIRWVTRVSGTRPVNIWLGHSGRKVERGLELSNDLRSNQQHF